MMLLSSEVNDKIDFERARATVSNFLCKITYFKIQFSLFLIIRNIYMSNFEYLYNIYE